MKEENELIVLAEVKYPVSIDEIKAFVNEWKEVPELDPLSEDKEQFNLVKKAHQQSVKLRTSIEKKREALKAPSLEYGRTVDRIAKEYKELVKPTELKLFAQRSKVEQYEKEQEQKKIDAERERVELIDSRITKIRMIPLDNMGKNSDELMAIYESLPIPESEEYQERLDEAIIIYKDTIQKLEGAIETAQKAEQAEAIQAEVEAKRKKEDSERAEKERLEREVFEAEKREFQEQKEAQERAIREQKEEIDRQNTLKEIEIQEQKEEQERAIREQQNKESYEKCFNEAYDAIEKYSKLGELTLDCIIEGKIPHVKWEVYNA